MCVCICKQVHINIIYIYMLSVLVLTDWLDFTTEGGSEASEVANSCMISFQACWEGLRLREFYCVSSVGVGLPR